MFKKISALLALWLLIGLGGIGLGCGSDSDDPPQMVCDGDSDCPSGYICGVSETCIELLIFDDEECPEDEEDCDLL